MKVYLILIIYSIAIIPIYSIQWEGIQDEFKNPYRALGISPWSSNDAIKEAYKTLVRKLHPDKNDGSTEEQFREVQKAYERLKSNPEESRFMGQLIGMGIFSAVVFVPLAGFYLFLWITYSLFYYLWRYVFLVIISLIISESFFPHYFASLTSSFLTSCVVVFGLLMGSRLYTIIYTQKKTTSLLVPKGGNVVYKSFQVEKMSVSYSKNELTEEEEIQQIE
jgi:hypothetical protein